MAILSWGKNHIQHAQSVSGAPSGAWTDIDTPKEDTTKLTPTAGTVTEAKEEGGEVVDSRSTKNSYELEFDIFVKKGTPRPFDDNDGVIPGEHAFRVTPEDPSCEGIQIDRSTLRVEESYSTAEGKMLHYVAKVLKPASGKMVKPYTENALGLSTNKLYFSSAADSTGKQVTASSTGNISAVNSTESWCTVTKSGKNATVKVSANEGTEPRTAIVTITADGVDGIVEVTQIPS